MTDYTCVKVSGAEALGDPKAISSIDAQSGAISITGQNGMVIRNAEGLNSAVVSTTPDVFGLAGDNPGNSKTQTAVTATRQLTADGQHTTTSLDLSGEGPAAQKAKALLDAFKARQLANNCGR